MGHCYVTSKWLQSRLGGHVARKSGHYYWLSPDGHYALDIVGDHFKNPPPLYKRTTHPLFRGGEIVHGSTTTYDDARTNRFADRANAAMDGRTVARVSFDLGDAYPGETPQKIDDMEQRSMHDEPGYMPGSGEYQFVYGNGDLHISPMHDHSQLAQHANIPSDHTGPFAVGYVTLSVGRATFQTSSNISLRALERVFKDYCKHVGWQWGGLTDIEGQPISDEFAPKKSYWWAYDHQDCHLNLGQDMQKVFYSTGADASFGRVDLDGEHARLKLATRISSETAEVLQEWADDFGLTLVSGNDNVLKTIEDLDMKNLYTPTPTDGTGQFFNEGDGNNDRAPGGVYHCPQCELIFPNWELYRLHRENEQPVGDPPTHEGPEMPNHDDPFPAHFTEADGQRIAVYPAGLNEARRVEGFKRYAEAFDYNHDDLVTHWVAYSYGCPVGYAAVDERGKQLVMIQSSVKRRGVMTALLDRVEQYHPELRTGLHHDAWQPAVFAKRGWVNVRSNEWKWAKGQQDASKLIEGPVPFIYDIDKDTITCGQPGARHSDIIGRFTPGGIVEGIFEPGGKVLIRTITNMPYTVRHMLELWYYSNPHYEVKSVHLRDDAGNDTKLASTDIGSYIRTMTAADPAAEQAYRALRAAGGKVYAVGGAVRDALLGKEPKDIDLMVTGLQPDLVRQALEALPGRVDLTGKDFGVFRVRMGGSEVEVALPRRERSTGVGHQDFDVQADHTMTPEEDLYRRDFTPNAMAVDLDSGGLIDPFGGADDIESGQFRTLNPQSLSDDPLRTVRALVLNGKHGLVPDDETRRQMEANAPGLAHLPAERVQAELDKLFEADSPADAIRLARETGVLPHVFPEVDSAFGYDQQNPHHEQELGEHLLSVLHHVTQMSPDPDLRLAALLHDIGKPASRWSECRECGYQVDGPMDKCPHCGNTMSGHYYELQHHDHDTGERQSLGSDHETVGASMAMNRLGELKGYSSDRIKRINDLVQHHMWSPFTTLKGARRHLARVGDHADDLFTLRLADQGGKSQYPTDSSFNVDRQRELVQKVRDTGQATSTSMLAVNGNDLINAGMTPGPQMGEVLRQLTNDVIEDPELNTPDQLLQLARQYGSF
jgi:tRNA nucleotidyltransferase/poly(A) polymerase